MIGDKHPSRQPKWIGRFTDLIHQHWHYHAPCSHINFMASWDEPQKVWQVSAAPVFQEVLGGPDDGKKVWGGFLFDMGDFNREPGVSIQEQAVASYCNECTPYPKLMASGTFEGHSFLLHVYLEPIAATETVEIIDTLNRTIRGKDQLEQRHEQDH